MTTPHNRTRIAVDAMGGDHGPVEIVPGAAAAARAGIDVLLVGDPDAVSAELAKVTGPERAHLVVVPSQGVVQEGESPIQALRQLPKASVAVACGLVQAGKADGFVSMGSTGATIAISVLGLGLLEGLERPVIGGPILSFASNTILVDIGSNVDTRPQQMVQFGALGIAFARTLLNVQNPRVALLSVGSEEGKGNRQTKEAYTLFKESGLNFVGNVEGHDLPLPSPKAEVVVCDGFVGNILLKLSEGVSGALSAYFRQKLATLPEAQRDLIAQELRSLLDASSIYGGAPVLGVKSVAVVGHGRARAATVEQAIKTAQKAVQTGLISRMQAELAKLQVRSKP